MVALRKAAGSMCIEPSSMEIIIIKVFYMTPEAIVAIDAFRKKTVDVGISFEIPAKGMQGHDIPGENFWHGSG